MACAGQTGDYSSRKKKTFQRASVTSLGLGTETPPKHNLQARRTLHKAYQNNTKPAKN
jgi:hypothetical protein